MTNVEQMTAAKVALKNIKKRYSVRASKGISSIKVVRQGNFTCVTLNDSIVGMSKRTSSDQSNPTTGFHVALNKALKFMLKIRK